MSIAVIRVFMKGMTKDYQENTYYLQIGYIG